MDVLTRCLWGDFRMIELRRYLAFESLTFCGLIFVSWLSYPDEHHYSIMTHTFSFFGSFESKHNPEWWWIFSIAMTFWGCATVPLVFYVYRRFVTVAAWGARLGVLLMLAGCAGVVLVACFPDAHGAVIGDAEWTDIHEKAALLVAAGFGLGIPWLGLLLLKDRFFGRTARNGYRFDHGRLLWPYLFWLTVTGTAMYFQIAWEFVYAERKAAADAAGAHFGSHWAEALNTRYSFPLWENITIYALFIFLMWFGIALPGEPVEQDGMRPVR
jgi:hypothetical protein